MEQIGYLYILANSAMPGLVKVGKTTRNSSERALELSGATGLPTPFIVVYEQLFIDCGAAESFVHAHLEQNGYRVTDKREFFNAPVNIIVKAISLAPGAIDSDSTEESSTEAHDFLSDRELDELDALSLTTSEPNHIWRSVLDDAEMYYYGLGDQIQDFSEAMRLFRRAANLGSLPAYGYIGTMYADGKGVRKDQSKALEIYKDGARRGSIYCYWKMGMLFVLDGNNSNAEKCFHLFIKNIPTKLPDSQRLTHGELSDVFIGCVILICEKMDFLPILETFISTWSSEIREKTEKFIGAAISGGDVKREENLLEVIEYINILNSKLNLSEIGAE